MRSYDGATLSNTCPTLVVFSASVTSWYPAHQATRLQITRKHSPILAKVRCMSLRQVAVRRSSGYKQEACSISYRRWPWSASRTRARHVKHPGQLRRRQSLAGARPSPGRAAARGPRGPASRSPPPGSAPRATPRAFLTPSQPRACHRLSAPPVSRRRGCKPAHPPRKRTCLATAPLWRGSGGGGPRLRPAPPPRPGPGAPCHHDSLAPAQEF